ncbi:hypothetical protein A2671_00645 [Candidatus Kaiserbacteria bacterium RIFCSPHIGHO2_01_FULL_49_13]|uniref:Uncharacterized protein n=1 Tax=Candidatus Kaiserbacteria bacterium RIFCSPHIGHO2_01_FULL_49_13 TaxID=1798477 RepID=A0A1F6CEB6_9BACT|nr:MAG: hypothetical protein A2671_00645 [Candidatus Kaiserbacteria bacterium RIFCSPHIGHO2_01_FULL_49_13]
MGLWNREQIAFASLTPDRQANIEIVLSAYHSVFVDKAYLTMPVSTGKRFYDVLERYGVRNVEELEKKRPGALREEIIVPNLEDGKKFAERFGRRDVALIVPGIFEARKQKWSQDEYMILWLRLITSSVKELHLSEGWEYSNGGAMEFVRGLHIQFRFLEEREDRMPLYDHKGNPVTIEEGAAKLAAAIGDLDRRGFDSQELRQKLSLIAGIALYLNDRLTSRHEYHLHSTYPFDWQKVVAAAENLKVPIVHRPGQ